MSAGSPSAYKFGGYKIDVSRRLLLRDDGEVLSLTSKVFDLLLFMVENPRRNLTKDEIMAAVWPDTIVEESNLTQNISILRRTLGEPRGENTFIATISGQGYRFVAEVTNVVEGAESATAVSSPVRLEKGTGATRRFGLPLFIAAIALVIVFAGIGVYLFRSKVSQSNSGRSKVLAILPFKPLVESDSDMALEMGMTDTLIARLTNMSGLILRPLGSVRKFAAMDQDPQAAGRELGADAVLDGNIQRQDEKIRVNVRLTDVASGESLWGGTFDEEYRDIFTVQDEISTKVAEALRLRLGSQAQASRRGTDNVDAYRLYMQGRLFQFRSTPKEIYQAIGFYQDAIRVDPNYALAYAALADAYRSLPITSDVDPRNAFPQSKAAAAKAIEINPDLAQAHVALGYVASWYEWDWKTAEDEMRRGVELDPESAESHRGLSILMTLLGRNDEAITEMRRSREIDPLSLPTNALEAQALFYAGRDAEAIERLNKTFEIDPNFWIARLMLARILIKQNRLDEALVELERSRSASGGNSEPISLIGYVHAKKGDREAAIRSVKELDALKKGSYSPAYNIAMIENGLGDKDEALDQLEDAVERKDVRLILLNIDHKWDGLRDDLRFKTILARLQLASD